MLLTRVHRQSVVGIYVIIKTTVEKGEIECVSCFGPGGGDVYSGAGSAGTGRAPRGEGDQCPSPTLTLAFPR